MAPVVHASAADILTRLAPNDVQLLPVRVTSVSEPYFLANVVRVVRCISDETSEEVQYWGPEDGQPEKTGKFQIVGTADKPDELAALLCREIEQRLAPGKP